jgi:hypothetical protein
VPYPVQGVQAIPGNGNAIVTWTAQPASRNGGQPITSYRITVKPPANGTLYYDLPVAGATKVRCPNDPSNTPNCYQRTIPSLANDQASPYTFEVRANNAVGFSLLDLATGGSTAKATPSLEAVAQLVPNATAQTLTTCTIATSEHRTCVQYVVPSGTGGVFGAQGGASVGLPTSFCNGACIGSTGAQNLGALAGYDDRTKPLVEIINWDSTTIPSSLAKQPVCATNSTATNCFPNNLPIYYETSAFLALNDLRGATFLNAPSGPHGPYVTHFCSLPTNRGGAGNVNYARPKPSGGYTDTAGSACIKSISVLTGLPSLRPDDKGDVRLVLNLTSDSDALAGHR